MSSSPVRFIILCAARTGSTMLRHLLNSHPDACCHGEVMAGGLQSFTGLENQPKSPLIAKLHQLRMKDPIAFLHEFVFFAGEMNAIGFKIKYEELTQPEFGSLLDALLQDRSLKVIHLRRRNRLKRVVSKVAATRIHGVFNVTHPSERPAAKRFTLEAKECEDDFQTTAAREEHFAAIFSDHSITEVVYEDIVSLASGVLPTLQKFLGLEVHPLQTRTQKMNPESPAEIVENFNDLRDYFAGTPYAAFFQE